MTNVVADSGRYFLIVETRTLGGGMILDLASVALAIELMERDHLIPELTGKFEMLQSQAAEDEGWKRRSHNSVDANRIGK